MRKGIIVSAITMAVSLSSTLACDIYGQSGIVEKNDLWISASQKEDVSGMDEETFNKVLDRVEEIYTPIIAARGKSLSVIRKWEDGTVNAFAQQTGNIWKISMFGGLARHKAITPDGFALVACHEIGHHIGGLPRKRSFFGVAWASNEGQSDYFGNTKCLRKYMERDSNNQTLVANMEIPALVIEKCEANFAGAEDIAMCQRGAMAGLSLGSLFKDLRNLPNELDFSNPDTNVVSRTNHNHPAPQCRLDTYFAGAICNRDHYSDVSDTDVNENLCSREASDVDGIRPLCWFKPVASN